MYHVLEYYAHKCHMANSENIFVQYHLGLLYSYRDQGQNDEKG